MISENSNENMLYLIIKVFMGENTSYVLIHS